MIHLIKNYANRKAALLKLEATEKSSLATGSIVVLILLTFLFLFFFSLFNIGIGFLLSDYLDSYVYGFLTLSGFYFVVLCIVLLAKKSIKKAVANKIIRSIK